MEQNNALLTEILAELRRTPGNVAPQPVPSAAVPKPQPMVMPLQPLSGNGQNDSTADRWAETVNAAFQQPNAEAVRFTLQTAFGSDGQPLLVVDFDDRGEYQQDHSYAQFSPTPQGCVLLLPLPGDGSLFAAFPYPYSPMWFLQGRDSLKALYDLEGSQQTAPAPTLQIKKPALMKRMEQASRHGDSLFAPQERGILVVRA
ncbi:MAG: hypothetical protein PHO41_07190 [Eubacteriales bacterium]|nr:hypothetical protein [Eubacteriales bacterium]